MFFKNFSKKEPAEINLQNFLEEFKSSKKTDILSFDVFDTLIHRRVDPEAVWIPVFDTLNDFLISYQKPTLSLASLYKSRQNARNTVKRKLKKTLVENQDIEITLTEWFEQWLHDLDIPCTDQTIKTLIDLEIESEKKVSYPNPILLDFLTKNTFEKTKIMFISDMYLSSENILDILESCGYPKTLWKDSIVSCEYRKGKHSGNLFKHLLDKEKNSENSEPSVSWTHIGDNLNSDVHQPQKYGIQAVHYDNPKVIDHQNKAKYYFENLLSGNINRAALLYFSLIDTPYDTPKPIQSTIAQNCLAPGLITYISEIYETVQKENLDALYFLAREGLVLKSLYKELAPLYKDRVSVPAHYLMVSRASIMAATSKNYGLKEMALGNVGQNETTLRKTLLPLVKDENSLLEEAQKIGIDSLDTKFNSLNHPGWFKLLSNENLLNIIDQKTNQAKKNILKHFESRGLLENTKTKIGICDIGWGGQIQEGIETLLKDRSLDVFGLYMAVNTTGLIRQKAGHKIYPLVCNANGDKWTDLSVFTFVESFETAIRSPHGTTLSHDENGNAVLADDTRPSRRDEKKDEPLLAWMHEAYIETAKRYVTLFPVFKPTRQEQKDYAVFMMTRLIRTPRLEEKKFYQKISHFISHWDDFEAHHGKSDKYNPLHWAKSIKTACWKEGAAGSYLGVLGELLITGYSGKFSKSNITTSEIQTPQNINTISLETYSPVFKNDSSVPELAIESCLEKSFKTKEKNPESLIYTKNIYPWTKEEEMRLIFGYTLWKTMFKRTYPKRKIPDCGITKTKYTDPSKNLKNCLKKTAQKIKKLNIKFFK